MRVPAELRQVLQVFQAEHPTAAAAVVPAGRAAAHRGCRIHLGACRAARRGLDPAVGLRRVQRRELPTAAYPVEAGWGHRPTVHRGRRWAAVAVAERHTVVFRPAAEVPRSAAVEHRASKRAVRWSGTPGAAGRERIRFRCAESLRCRAPAGRRLVHRRWGRLKSGHRMSAFRAGLRWELRAAGRQGVSRPGAVVAGNRRAVGIRPVAGLGCRPVPGAAVVRRASEPRCWGRGVVHSPAAGVVRSPAVGWGG